MVLLYSFGGWLVRKYGDDPSKWSRGTLIARSFGYREDSWFVEDTETEYWIFDNEIKGTLLQVSIVGVRYVLS